MPVLSQFFVRWLFQKATSKARRLQEKWKNQFLELSYHASPPPKVMSRPTGIAGPSSASQFIPGANQHPGQVIRW